MGTYSVDLSDDEEDVDYCYKCDCGSEMLIVEPEINIIDKDKHLFFLNVSIWLFGYNSSPTLFEKLRHCWYILKTGQNYSDQIILSLASAKQLSEDLSNILERLQDGQ